MTHERTNPPRRCKTCARNRPDPLSGRAIRPPTAFISNPRQHDADYPMRVDIAYLGNALEIEPQPIRLALGEALLKAKRRSDALLVLQPMLDDPHDDEWRKLAAALLARFPALPT